MAQLVALAFFVVIVLFPHNLEAKGVVSVLYDTISHKYRLVQGKQDGAVAWATFSDQVNTTGWSFLEVHTNGSYDDLSQAFAAGVVEGALTAEFIETDWKNRGLDTYCSEQPEFCAKLEKFLAANQVWMEEQMANDPTSAYWYQVKLVQEQLKGLQEGYSSSKATLQLSSFDFLLIQLSGDLEDLQGALGGKSKRVKGSGSCSALIKLLPSSEELFISQVTWNDFLCMLRVFKLYDFQFHRAPGDPEQKIASQNQSFSSYPGLLMSGDDFYMLSSGMVSQETTIGNENKDLTKYIQPASVLEWLRTIVANRLATSGGEWTYLFSKFNSGTYNNQWMVLDYKLFTPGMQVLKPGTLWVLEQIPGVVEMADVTVHLQEKGYWASYNLPYFPLIYNTSGVPADKEKYGPWFDYNLNPRAQIFRRDQHKVVDIDSMMKLMRYNDYKNDPLSKCKCNPPYSAENAISARCDLNPANGTYPFGALGHRRHGGTDAKITNFQMFKSSFACVAVSGPTNDQQPAFQWSTSSWKRPEKHPDKWDFKPMVVKWDS